MGVTATRAVFIHHGTADQRDGGPLVPMDSAAAAQFLREYRAASGRPRKVFPGWWSVPGVDHNGGTTYSGPASLVVLK